MHKNAQPNILTIVKSKPNKIPSAVLDKKPKNEKCIALKKMLVIIIPAHTFFVHPINSGCTVDLKSNSSKIAGAKAITKRAVR